MKDDDLEYLYQINSYYTEWLNRCKNAQNIVPIIQQNLDANEWEIDALKNMPDESDKIPYPDFSNNLKQEFQFIRKSLPMMPEYNNVILGDATALSTSSSSDIYNHVVKYGDIETEEANIYSETFAKKYQQMQSFYERPKEVRRLISSLKENNVLDRFDKASDAYTKARAGVIESTATANEIRNLLNGVKGLLFEKARNKPKENMKWEKMANRLAKDGKGSIQHKSLLDQISKFKELIARLSDILKDRDIDSGLDLDNVWTQVLDNLFIILTLVNI